MERKEISVEVWRRMLKSNCDKGKHRLRMNRYGICWCVICGLLSNTNNAEPISDGESLLIKCK